MKLSKLAQKLQIRLINNLPGKDEQWRMRVTSDKSYNFDNTEEDAIQSAVLILLYKENGVI